MSSNLSSRKVYFARCSYSIANVVAAQQLLMNMVEKRNWHEGERHELSNLCCRAHLLVGEEGVAVDVEELAVVGVGQAGRRWRQVLSCVQAQQ